MTEAHVENLTDEIQRVVKEQIEAVRGAISELRVVLVEIGLTEAFQEATAPLDAEDAKLTAEIQVLSKSRDELRPRVEAMQRLSATRIDECLVAGDDQGAAARRREVEELAAGLRGLQEKIHQHGDRCTALAAERSRLAKEIFEAAYPQFPLATFALLGATVDLLDGLKKGMFAYAESTGISGDQLPKSYHIDNLLPTELPGSDRQLSRRVDAWFAPQRR